MMLTAGDDYLTINQSKEFHELNTHPTTPTTPCPILILKTLSQKPLRIQAFETLTTWTPCLAH